MSCYVSFTIISQYLTQVRVRVINTACLPLVHVLSVNVLHNMFVLL